MLCATPRLIPARIARQTLRSIPVIESTLTQTSSASTCTWTERTPHLACVGWRPFWLMRLDCSRGRQHRL